MLALLDILLLLSIFLMSGEGIRDFGNHPTVIETDSLPTLADGRSVDSRSMPSIGNGHLATVIYNDTIFINGVYNGELSESHRARIPAEINMRVRIGNEESRQVYRQYRLDMKNGYWEENITVEDCRVTQRVYTHQFYTRLLVTEIFAQRQGAATGNLMVYLNSGRGSDSTDINFNDQDSFNGGNWRSQGTTIVPEIPGGHNSVVYTFWSTVPPIIHIPSHKNSIRYAYIMSIDTNEEMARESFESGSWIADNNPEHFFDLHVGSWRKKWEGGGIELSGDLFLEKLVYSSFYYILSSLPSIDSHRESNAFSGISTGGLPHGGEGEKDRGHVSWDQEQWVFPAVLPFYPGLARSLISYRINTLPAAAVQADNSGREGLLYSWKSAATGIDVTPRYEPSNHFHVNGDISFAVRQYMAMTWDRLWMQEEGACSMVKDIASFWYSKLKWNATSSQYDINDVSSLDSTRGSISNSVYTNAAASLALHYSKYAACLCNRDVNTYAPQEWIHAAQNIHWEYNRTAKYNPEYQGYVNKGAGATVKQSGAVMLSYPLMWGLSNSNIQENLRVYSAVIPDSVSSTAWAMLTINRLELGQEQQAQQTFEKSYRDYVTEPYKMWKEYPNDGMSNYLSGMGSYIQTLLYGYGGLRIHLEYLYMNPRLPKNVHSMTFRDIDYLGSRFNVRVTSVLIQISVHSIGIYPLRITLTDTGKVYHMNRGTSIPLRRGSFTIRSKARTECPLPDDNILPLSSQSKYTPAAHISAGSRTMQFNINIYYSLLLSLRAVGSLISL